MARLSPKVARALQGAIATLFHCVLEFGVALLASCILASLVLLIWPAFPFWPLFCAMWLVLFVVIS
jgi:hypothetical protein